MIHTHNYNGLPVQTGDILCTKDGTDHNWLGRFWGWVGYLVPGLIDHAIVYLGPGGRCVEAAAKGVLEFHMPGDRWDAPRVADIRLLHDTLVGVAYPFQELNLSQQEEERIRSGIAAYCLEKVGKPYNANFLNTVTDEAFYCSQLIYLAYRKFGIDLGVSPVRLTSEPTTSEEAPLLILPTTLLNNSPHRYV
jgi:hypothetical protein